MPKTDWDMWASRSKWPKPRTPRASTLTRSPLELGSPSSRGRRGLGATHPLPLLLPRPLLYPLPTATRSPATQCPPGQKEWRGWRRNWAGGKGRTKGGDRTGQIALAENGAERRRRRRKGNKGRNHCGCKKPLSGKLSCRCTPQRAQVSAGVGKPSMDSECASECTWSTARATARLRDSRPWSSQTGQAIQGLR